MNRAVAMIAARAVFGYAVIFAGAAAPWRKRGARRRFELLYDILRSGQPRWLELGVRGDPIRLGRAGKQSVDPR